MAAASAPSPTSNIFQIFEDADEFATFLKDFEAELASPKQVEARAAAAAANLLGKPKPNVIRDAEYNEILRTDPNWMHYDYTIPRVPADIINVRCTFGLKRTLDLPKIALSLPNVEYDPKSFEGCVMKIHWEDCDPTAKIFSNGKINITGAKSVARCLAAANTIFHKIKQAGIDVGTEKVPKVLRITNIQAKIQLPWNVDIETLYKESNEKLPKKYKFMEYQPEPERLKVNFPKPRCKIGMFTIGAAIVTGLTKEEDLERVLKWVWIAGRRFSYSY